MRRQQIFPVLFLAAIVVAGTACKTFVVKNVNYAHQIESVLTPDSEGIVHDKRHGITFNINPFQKQEFGESDSSAVEEVRMIRNDKGFYFITANHFKHVYVMKPIKKGMELEKKIKVSEEGIAQPAFNMRDGMVQLVKVDANEMVQLNENGIKKQKEDNKEKQS